MASGGSLRWHLEDFPVASGDLPWHLVDLPVASGGSSRRHLENLCVTPVQSKNLKNNEIFGERPAGMLAALRTPRVAKFLRRKR